MPNKIKIVLVIVAIVAGFLVYKFAQYVHAVANQNSTLQQGTPLPTANQDVDNDGLSNQQESIWNSDPFNPDSDGDGFKDGEEVDSGHNPLVPGPDDLIGADNLTEQFSELTVAGLAEGSLQPDSPDYDQALADVSNLIADSAKYAFAKVANDDRLHVTNTNNKTITTYLRNLAPLAQNFTQLLQDQYEQLPLSLNHIESGDFNQIAPFYKTQAEKYQNLVGQGFDMTVPEKLRIQHTAFLSLVLKMEEISKAIAQGNSDPIKASFAFSNFGDAYPEYQDLLESYRSALEASDFNPTELESLMQ